MTSRARLSELPRPYGRSFLVQRGASIHRLSPSVTSRSSCGRSWENSDMELKQKSRKIRLSSPTSRKGTSRRKVKRSMAAAGLIAIFLASSAASAYDVYERCFTEAGRSYNIAPVLLWAIAKHESRFNPAAVNRNRNGTYDFGVMQVNSAWYRVLGHERWMSLGDPCFNIHVGAWILSECVARHGYTWAAVGCYNSSNRARSAAYSQKIMSILKDVEVETHNNRRR